MKTTIELDDALFQHAKRHALAHGVTLKALIEQGLRSSLAQPAPSRTTPYRFPVITQMANNTSAQTDVNAVIDAMRVESLARFNAPRFNAQ